MKEETLTIECQIKKNKYPFLLWFKTITKPATVDNLICPTMIKTDIATEEIVQANFWEIIFLKYLIPIFLILLLVDLKMTYFSMFGLLIAIFIHIIIISIKYVFEKDFTPIILFILCVSYILFAFLNFQISTEIGVGLIINYFIQYYVSLFFIINMHNDIKRKGYLYYKIKNESRLYFQINFKRQLNHNKISNSIFEYIFVVVLIVISLVVGINDFGNRKNVNNFNNKEIISAAQAQLKKLDLQATEFGILRYHVIWDIKSYQKIPIKKGTKYLSVNQETLKVKNDAFRGKFNKEKSFELPGFMYNNMYYIVSKGIVYLLVSDLKDK